MGALALRRINLGYFAHISVRVGGHARSGPTQQHRTQSQRSAAALLAIASQKKYKSHVRVRSTALQQTMERIHSKSQARPHRTDTRHTAPIMCSAARGACGMRR